jgi:hypothetical protein
VLESHLARACPDLRWTDADIGALLLQLSSAMADEVDFVATLSMVAA